MRMKLKDEKLGVCSKTFADKATAYVDESGLTIKDTSLLQSICFGKVIRRTR